MRKHRQPRRRTGVQDRPQAFGANYYRSQPARKVSAKQSRRRSWFGGFLLIAVLAAAAAGLYWSKVDSVSVIGVEDEQLQQHVEEAVEESYPFLWQAYVKPTSQTIEKPAEISHIELEVLWREKALHARIIMREPTLLWESNDTLYVVDEEGVVIGPDGVDDASLPVVRDDSGLPTEAGGRVTPSEFVSFAVTITESDLPVRELWVVDTTRELYVGVEDGYYIRFDTEGDLRQQLGNAARVKEIAAEDGQSIEEYIDVRIPHRAYYR